MPASASDPAPVSAPVPAPVPVLLFDGLSAVAQPVQARATAAGLELFGTDGAASPPWPLASVRRTDTDLDGAGVVLCRVRGPERLLLPDDRLLVQLRAQGAAAGRVRRRWHGRDWSVVALVVALSLAGTVVAIDQFPALAAPFVPRPLEQVWSAGIENTLLAGQRRCQARPGQTALLNLLARLSDAAGLPEPPPLVVADSRMVNAFTLPDGRMVIMRGLLAEATDGDELAGVMAHELGHAVHHDPTREALRELELEIAARSVGWSGSFAGTMTALSYQREAESAADASAVATLRRAGLRSDGLARFLARIAEPGAVVPAFMSDHPSSAARVAALAGASDSTGQSALTAAEWADVQAICRRPRPD